jgi:hypothetical protein
MHLHLNESFVNLACARSLAVLEINKREDYMFLIIFVIAISKISLHSLSSS